MDTQVFIIWILDLVLQVSDNNRREKRKENPLKKDVHLTIERNLKKIIKIICHRLTAKVSKEVTQEVVQELNIKISSHSKISNTNNICLNTSILKISTLLHKDNNKTLDKTAFHLVTTVLEVNKLHKFTSLLRSSSSLHRFHQINSWMETRDHTLHKISIIYQQMQKEQVAFTPTQWLKLLVEVMETTDTI